jgi:hypothetical protein
VKTFHLWLLLLAAMAWTAPLGAEEINAPDAHWHDTATESSSVSPARGESDAPMAVQHAAGDESQPVDPLAQNKPLKDPGKPSDDQESHERILGLVPAFNVVNDASTARALSVREKWKFSARETFSPMHFVTTGLTAGIGQARDDFHAYGQGMEGYGKRYGAAFGDSGLNTFFGKFLLPSLLHDDPRYFRQGSGGFTSRLLHAASASIVTRRDNGTSRPNYSNMMGGFMACAVGNLYYPENERGVGTTLERGSRYAASASITAILQEFWPDIRNKLFKKKK